MDKVLLWGVLREKSFTCAVSHRCLSAQGSSCKDCQQWAVVNPEKLAALEAQLATKDEAVKALEAQLAELTTACGLKDGAFKRILDIADDSCTDFAEGNPLMRKGCLLPDIEQVAKAALSQTPEAVKREAEDAALPSIDDMAGIAPGLHGRQEDEEYERIGRAVVEWQKREAAAQEVIGEPIGPYTNGWRRAVYCLGKAIAEAREGEPHA